MAKNFLSPYKSLVNGDMSQSTLISAVTDIRYLDNISILLTFTGTPTGNFQVFGGHSGNTADGVALSLPIQPLATGTSGRILLDLNQVSVPYVWVLYTKSSGVGSLTVSITGKSLS